MAHSITGLTAPTISGNDMLSGSLRSHPGHQGVFAQAQDITKTATNTGAYDLEKDEFMFNDLEPGIRCMMIHRYHSSGAPIEIEVKTVQLGKNPYALVETVEDKSPLLLFQKENDYALVVKDSRYAHITMINNMILHSNSRDLELLTKLYKSGYLKTAQEMQV